MYLHNLYKKWLRCHMPVTLPPLAGRRAPAADSKLPHMTKALESVCVAIEADTLLDASTQAVKLHMQQDQLVKGLANYLQP
jgi:hypothetical protein